MNIKFKATLNSLMSLLISFQVFSQNDEMNVFNNILPVEGGEENTLYSRHTYDSMGNLFMVKKRFDHIPTHSDSIAFANSVSGEIDKMMEEYGREQQKYYESIKIMNSKKKKQNPKIKRKIQQ